MRPDWPTILRSVIRWTLVWGIIRGIATWQGAPEVICATPLAAGPVERSELPGLIVFSALLMAGLGLPVCIAISLMTGWLYVRSRELR